MSGADARKYSGSSAAVAAAAGVLLLPFALGRGSAVLVFGATGWLIVAAIGVVVGAGLVARHGQAQSKFLWWFGAGMALRILAVGAALAIARWRDPQAAWAYLTGIGAAWLATQGFEMAWFARRTRAAR